MSLEFRPKSACAAVFLSDLPEGNVHVTDGPVKTQNERHEKFVKPTKHQHKNYPPGLTNVFGLKDAGWKMIHFLLGNFPGLFSGAFAVSFFEMLQGNQKLGCKFNGNRGTLEALWDLYVSWRADRFTVIPAHLRQVRLWVCWWVSVQNPALKMLCRSSHYFWRGLHLWLYISWDIPKTLWDLRQHEGAFLKWSETCEKHAGRQTINQRHTSFMKDSRHTWRPTLHIYDYLCTVYKHTFRYISIYDPGLATPPPSPTHPPPLWCG